MEEVLVVVCHNEASISFRIGLQYKLLDLKAKICSEWIQFSPMSIQIFHKYGEQQKVVECDLDLQYLVTYALYNKFTTLDLHVSSSVVLQQRVRAGSSSSAVVQQRVHAGSSSSAVVPYGHPEVTRVTDYDMPNKVKEPLKSLLWLGLFKEVNQVFPGGVEQVRLDIMKYHAAKGLEYMFIKNDKVRVTVCCARVVEQKCKWFLHAASLDGNEGSAFFIKELVNEHTCGGGLFDTNHPQVSKKLVSSLIADELKQNPNKRTKDIVEQFRREYGITLSRYYAYAGKKHALNTSWGENDETFKYLIWYTDKLRETNPGSVVVLEVENGTNKFQRLFISFGACIRGFNFCRPLLFIDATHLKSKYLGHLFAATGLTGNNDIYPLAYAVVSSENNANCKWFLENLRDCLSPVRKYTIVTDRGVALVNQIPEVFKDCYHGWCFWHMRNNINACLPKANKTYNLYILDLFRKCAYANTHKDFNENMDKLKLVKNQKLQNYLLDAPVDKWASMYFRGRRYGELCSNVAECFNGWIREEREMPIAVMADEIRKRLMKQRCERLELCVNSLDWRRTLCPEREIELHNNKMHGREYPVIKSSEFVYEVQSSITQSVDLKKRTCSCNRWRIDGFPCAHAVRCIMANGEDPYKYVEPYFTTKFYQGSYALPIKPVPNSERPSKVSPKSCVLAPDAMPQQPGRPPKRKRIPNTGSIPNKKLRQCGKCKLVTNHNRRTCNAEQ